MPILEQLRLHTRERHARLERRLLSPPGLAERARYAVYLQRLSAVWRALSVASPHRGELARFLPDLSERLAKQPLFERDLRALEERAEVELAPLPSWACSAELFGALYVMEGSQLGGPVLARQLSPLGFPSAYLDGCGAALRSKWQTFCLALEQFANTDARRSAVCSGAGRMFEAVESWLEAGDLLAKG